jgi:ABC-2 type transport system permease protein
MTAAAPARVATVALVGHELRMLARRPENLLVAVVVPMVVLVFFSIVPEAPGAGRVDTLLPAALAIAVIAAAFVNLGIATAYERSYGVLKRLGGAPVTRGSVVMAKIAAVLVVSAVTGLVLVVVAFVALGWQPSDSGVRPERLAGALALGTGAFAGLGLALAGTLRAEGTLAIANGLFVGLVLFGGIVVPVSELPDALAHIARALPSSALVDAIGSALGGGLDGTWSLAVLGGWTLCMGAVAARTFRWD